MSGRRTDRDEKLTRPPLSFPRPRGGAPALVRWVVAAALMGLAALLVGARPVTSATPTESVVVAARDLDAGHSLSASDLVVRRVARAAVPSGATDAVTALRGRVTAGAVRSGEILTDLRVLGPALVATLAGADSTAAPIRLSDRGASALLRPGDHIDIVATSTGGDSVGETQTAAEDVVVLAVPAARPDDPGDGALVVIAASPRQARALAHAEVASRLSFTVRHR